MNSMDTSDDLPLLTEVAGDTETTVLPLLTEIVPTYKAALHTAGKQETLPRPLNLEEMHQLVQQLEVHLETAFTNKLNTQLEQLQRLAVDLAISEFKAELPQLLREALIKAVVSRKS